MPHPRDWQGEQMARSSPGGGGGGGVWAQLELTGALASSKFWAFSKKKLQKNDVVWNHFSPEIILLIQKMSKATA